MNEYETSFFACAGTAWLRNAVVAVHPDDLFLRLQMRRTEQEHHFASD